MCTTAIFLGREVGIDVCGARNWMNRETKCGADQEKSVLHLKSDCI